MTFAEMKTRGFLFLLCLLALGDSDAQQIFQITRRLQELRVVWSGPLTLCRAEDLGQVPKCVPYAKGIMGEESPSPFPIQPTVIHQTSCSSHANYTGGEGVEILGAAFDHLQDGNEVRVRVLILPSLEVVRQALGEKGRKTFDEEWKEGRLTLRRLNQAGIEFADLPLPAPFPVEQPTAVTYEQCRFELPELAHPGVPGRVVVILQPQENRILGWFAVDDAPIRRRGNGDYLVLFQQRKLEGDPRPREIQIRGARDYWKLFKIPFPKIIHRPAVVLALRFLP